MGDPGETTPITVCTATFASSINLELALQHPDLRTEGGDYGLIPFVLTRMMEMKEQLKCR